MRRSWIGLAVAVLFHVFAIPLVAADAPLVPADWAAEVLRESGVKGGLVVHLGAGIGDRTAALRVNDRFHVHGLERSADKVATGRELLRQAEVVGPVSLDRWSGTTLPYIDNLVNLVVADGDPGVAAKEIERVLAPRGVALLRRDGQWTKTVKPWPAAIDEWTHYLHDATGNAVAHDQVVGPPERLQWLGSPRWSRHHDRMASMSALVSSGGRIFYVMDEGSRVSILLPSHWQLIARDAFNGTILWKQPIPEWHNQLWPLKSGPTQLARRLVAIGDRVYVTPGVTAPLTCLDAATGEKVREYEGTAGTEELLHVSGAASGLLVAMVNRGASELKEYAPKFNTGDQGRVGGDYHWNEQPRDIVVLDAESGTTLWKRTAKVAPLTLAADGQSQRVVYCDGEKVLALDLRTGRELWASDGITRRRLLPFHFGPRLVLHREVALFAGGDAKMRAFALADGKSLWEAPHAASGYQSPQDVIVTGGLVWCAPTTSGRDTGVFTGRDPLTGDVKKEFPPNVETYWFHHRCYIAKATDRFLIPSRTGIEFVDFAKGEWDINHWVRGGCLYGVMPCNGLLYAPPHNCACYPEAKLFGMNVLAPAASPVPKSPENERLERGPAYAEKFEAEESDADWPAFRHDAARSGSTKTAVGANVEEGWKADLGGRLSSPVIAGGLVFVAQVDAHTLHALASDGGRTQWTFVAGGRIDSPPTIYQGRVVFGSADGWVYCLRAKTGELIWRFRGGPADRRLCAFEQLESVWPVHGSVLVQDGIATFVAGRSCFLDSGLRYVRLNVVTGEKLTETVLDAVDPETGRDLQERLKTLQMPAGLADILSSDGKHVYLRSQKFDAEGKRIGLGPATGDAVAHGRDQRGEGVHLFAATGYLDDEWFHRSEWVWGRNFAGGHNGYYQAGKVTPAGRLLVFDDKNVFGFGKQPQYYKWTTTMEHQLFSAPKEQPEIAKLPAAAAGKTAPTVDGIEFATNKVLDPAEKPIAVEAWINPGNPNGTIVSHGGPQNGFALFLRQNRLLMAVRSGGELSLVESRMRVPEGWSHVVGQLGADKSLRLYVNGKLLAKGTAKSFVAATPKQPLEIGRDQNGAVGDYESPFPFDGQLDEVRVYFRELTEEEIALASSQPAQAQKLSKSAVLALSFDRGTAADDAPHSHPGAAAGVDFTDGRQGKSLVLDPAGRRPGAKRRPAQQAGAAPFAVKHNWNGQVPLFARAMVLAGDTLFVAGPPDLIDEEESFKQLTERDTAVHFKLQQQDEAWQGKHGGVLYAVNPKTGEKLHELKTDALPTWDGMAAAQGQLFMTTHDGKVVCLKPKR